MRKNTFQILSIVLILGLLPQFAVAGGIDNKQNWSAAYVSGPSRNAAIDGADAAAYNPAGIVHLSSGLTLALDDQFISLDYDHTIGGTDYGMDETPNVPSFFAIYKKDKWGLYFTFTIPGGGGEVNYKKGNIITKKIGNALQAGAFAAGGIPAGGSLSGENAYAKSVDYGLTAGFSYAVTDEVSLSAGVRRVKTEKNVDIHATYTVGGFPIPLIGKYEQDADGYGGVFGLNYKPNNTLNFGLRYETQVDLDWDTTIPAGTNAAGAALLAANNRVDGGSYARDLPAVLGVGMEWKATDKLTIKPSLTYYFEDSADWDTQNNKIDHNSYDLALSFGYQIDETWSASCGYMYTYNGMDPNDFGIIEQMSPPLDAHTIALGGKYRYNDRVAVSLGVMGNFYVSDKANATYLAPGVVYSPETKYSKTNGVVALSMEYRFL
jgi:long-chain fatty acid transport protein